MVGSVCRVASSSSPASLPCSMKGALSVAASHPVFSTSIFTWMYSRFEWGLCKWEPGLKHGSFKQPCLAAMQCKGCAQDGSITFCLLNLESMLGMEVSFLQCGDLSHLRGASSKTCCTGLLPMMNRVRSMAAHALLCIHADSFPMPRASARLLSGMQPGRGACLAMPAGALQRDMQELPLRIPCALTL